MADTHVKPTFWAVQYPFQEFKYILAKYVLLFTASMYYWKQRSLSAFSKNLNKKIAILLANGQVLTSLVRLKYVELE